MSSKIEATITRLNTNIETMSKKLSTDELTGLPKKSVFETDIRQLYIEKVKAFILIIKITDLVEFAKVHTSGETNNFIKKVCPNFRND